VSGAAADGVGAREAIVQRFKKHLVGGAAFKLARDGDHYFVLRAQKCIIRFSFERDEDGCVILVARPGSLDQGMHLYLLRYLFKAKDVSGFEWPESSAEVMNRYMQPLLAGNFSIAEEYHRVKDRFFVWLLETRRLPENDPVKVKQRDFDISWLSDWAGRRGGA
jgi:hypothetical protein